MAVGQKIRGLVGQSMSGRRGQKVLLSYSFPAGNHTWVCPRTGLWRFVLWGAGGGADTSLGQAGGSGALYIAERRVSKGQVILLGVGGGTNPAFAAAGSGGGNTTATMPSGEVITAGGAAANAGGVATQNRPDDIVLSGTAGVTIAGVAGATGGGTNPGAGGVAGGGSIRPGSGAPGYGPYRGGDGAAGLGGNTNGRSPGGGGTTTSDKGTGGGDGLAVVHLVRV